MDSYQVSRPNRFWIAHICLEISGFNVCVCRRWTWREWRLTGWTVWLRGKSIWTNNYRRLFQKQVNANTHTPHTHTHAFLPEGKLWLTAVLSRSHFCPFCANLAYPPSAKMEFFLDELMKCPCMQFKPHQSQLWLLICSHNMSELMSPSGV